MKIFLTLLTIFFSSSTLAEKIILDCKCEEVVDYTINKDVKCYRVDDDRVIEIDLINEQIDFLDSAGKLMLDRIIRYKKGVMGVTKFDENEIRYSLAYDDYIILNILNRYTGDLKQIISNNSKTTRKKISICKRTNALF